MTMRYTCGHYGDSNDYDEEKEDEKEKEEEKEDNEGGISWACMI